MGNFKKSGKGTMKQKNKPFKKKSEKKPQQKIAVDKHTPTIDKISSVLDFLPDRSQQQERLEIFVLLQ